MDEIGPVRPRAWLSWDEVAPVFAGPADPDRAHDATLYTRNARDLVGLETLITIAEA